MPIKQSFNKKIGSWVKFEKTSKGTKILNVKEREPRKPFKGVPKMK